MKKKEKYLILFVLSILLFLFFRLPYRKFIYTNKVFDFFIADTSPNFFTVFLFVFLKKWQDPQHKNLALCFFTFLGLVIYEYLIQTFIYSGARVDVLDILSSFIAVVLVYFICQKIDSNIK